MKGNYNDLQYYQLTCGDSYSLQKTVFCGVFQDIFLHTENNIWMISSVAYLKLCSNTALISAVKFRLKKRCETI